MITFAYWFLVIYCAIGLLCTLAVYNTIKEGDPKFLDKLSRLEIDLMRQHITQLLLIVFISSPAILVLSFLGIYKSQRKQ